MHRVRRLRVGRLHQAEDLPGFLIQPIAQVVHPVRSLRRQIGLVGTSDVSRRHPALHVVYVHEQWHLPFLSS